MMSNYLRDDYLDYLKKKRFWRRWKIILDESQTYFHFFFLIIIPQEWMNRLWIIVECEYSMILPCQAPSVIGLPSNRDHTISGLGCPDAAHRNRRKLSSTTTIGLFGTPENVSTILIFYLNSFNLKYCLNKISTFLCMLQLFDSKQSGKIAQMIFVYGE